MTLIKRYKAVGIMFMSVLGVLTITSCSKNDDVPSTTTSSKCDFSKLTESETDTYTFNPPFSDSFTQSSRWKSENAEFLLVYSTGQLVSQSDDTSVASEAWNLYEKQMPYNKSWEISVDVHLPLYWNANGGKEAQVGAGLFVGKPVASGQSSKVYECNMAVVNGGGRFVQAQLIANRLGDDPIDVQHSKMDNSKEKGRLKITFCSMDKKLSLYLDGKIVGSGKGIDAQGLDNWGLSDTDVMDVGIMGFAENTNIENSYSPRLSNFRYSIY